MVAYAFWNNKGGVGKSYLCFIASCEYAHRHPEADVYVIDMCPQANVSETLLGGFQTSPTALRDFIGRSPRATVAGYIEARLSSPFRQVDEVEPFIVQPYAANKHVPQNLYLVCGDNLLEILAEAIRQTSQLPVPIDSWKRVIEWIKDLTTSLTLRSNDRSANFFVDCNPSFAIYTQLALAACRDIVIPFTADDSSRRAIENVIALAYGIGDRHIATYARINFSRRAKEEGVTVPLLHTFVSNRVTIYEGKPSKAFEAVAGTITETVTKIHSRNRQIFSNPAVDPGKSFITVPDYHTASVVSGTNGIPLHRLTAGPKMVADERVQINQVPLTRYREALETLVSAL